MYEICLNFLKKELIVWTKKSKGRKKGREGGREGVGKADLPHKYFLIWGNYKMAEIHGRPDFRAPVFFWMCTYEKINLIH
jgi:hypothetical protein